MTSGIRGTAAGSVRKGAKTVICTSSTGCGIRMEALPDEERLPLSAVKRPAGQVQSKKRRDDPGLHDFGFFS